MDGWAAGANNTAQLSQENKLKLDEIQCTIYVDWTKINYCGNQK
jgi:hypothetical protein